MPFGETDVRPSAAKLSTNRAMEVGLCSEILVVSKIIPWNVNDVFGGWIALWGFCF